MEAILGNSAWAILIFTMDLLQLDRMLDDLHLQVGGGSLIATVLINTAFIQ